MSIGEDCRVMQLDFHVPDFLRKLEAKGGPPLSTLSPAEARNVPLTIQRPVNITKLPAESSDRTIADGPTGDISLRLVREIATGAQATVVFVDHARSPKAKYPVAIEQAYAATKWVAEHGASIGVDPSRLVVAGDSVGGNIVAAVTLLATEREGTRGCHS